MLYQHLSEHVHDFGVRHAFFTQGLIAKCCGSLTILKRCGNGAIRLSFCGAWFRGIVCTLKESSCWLEGVALPPPAWWDIMDSTD